MAFFPFPPSTCGLGVQSPFSPSVLLFLESSILSCKAACPLFRYHLHINAEVTVPLDICYFLLLSFIRYFPLHFVVRFVRGVTLSD